jgi:hypothetical protein
MFFFIEAEETCDDVKKVYTYRHDFTFSIHSSKSIHLSIYSTLLRISILRDKLSNHPEEIIKKGQQEKSQLDK